MVIMGHKVRNRLVFFKMRCDFFLNLEDISNSFMHVFIQFLSAGVIGLPGTSIDGQKGDIGDVGYEGAPGRNGLPGLAGFAGLQGQVGIKGEQGMEKEVANINANER